MQLSCKGQAQMSIKAKVKGRARAREKASALPLKHGLETEMHLKRSPYLSRNWIFYYLLVAMLLATVVVLHSTIFNTLRLPIKGQGKGELIMHGGG